MKNIYLLAALLFCTAGVFGKNLTGVEIIKPGVNPNAVTAVSYTWAGAGTASWATATNWTPNGVPVAGDDVAFTGAAAVTVTDVPTISLSGFAVTGAGEVTLQSAASVTVSITGGAAPQFNIANSSSLILGGSFAISINLLAATTGSVWGMMTAQGSGTTAHRLTAADAGAIIFQTGAVYKTATGFGGNPFGTASLNSIIFKTGATFWQGSGSNAFGATAPNSVVTFEAGSLYKYTQAAVPSFSGRTYANFEFDVPTPAANATGSSALNMHNLTVTSGTLNINITGTPGHSIKGNIAVAAGATLSFTPLSASTINLNGPAEQTVTNLGTFTTGGFSTLSVTNILNCGTSVIAGSGTILVANGGTLKVGSLNPAGAVAGNIATSGALILAAASTVEFNGAGNQTASSRSFGNIIFNNSNTVTLLGAITANGNLDINAGTILMAGSFIHNLKGNWLNGGSFTAGTSTMKMNGTAAQTMSGSTFYNLDIDNAAGVTLLTIENVTNQLSLTNGLLSLNGFALNISNLATVQRSAGSISGTPVYAGYTDFIYINAALITTHPELPNTNNTIRNLTMNGAGGITLANEIYVKGTLTLTNGIITSTPVTFLQMGPNDGGALLGAVSGGNGSSYVFGPVRRNYENNLMTTLKLYPVGSLGKYRPLMINMSHSSATPTVYTVSIIEPNDLWTAGNLGSVVKVSQNRRYDVDEVGVSGNTINSREVTLWWNDDDGVSNFATLVLGAYDQGGGSNKWKKLNAATTTAPSGGDLGYLYGELNPNDVFKYAVATEDVENVLPISVEYFRGSKQSNGNLLDWKVSCTGSPYATLVLERSADGRNFIVVNSQEATALRCLSPFNFTDAGAVPGINFYRLKLVDADGKYSYSQIVALLNTDKGYEIISMMPNPAREKAILSISSAVKTTLDLVISDISGKQLSKQRTSLIAGNNQLALNLSNLAAGTYQVTAITAEGVMKSIRFVKQ